MQTAMSFVAGVILGVALYHLIPHSLAQIPDPDAIGITVWWMVLGMIMIIFLLRVFRFHQHDFSEYPRQTDAIEYDNNTRINSLNWLGICVGVGIHSVTEGIALGASVRSEIYDKSETVLVSFGLFLAIFLHKPLDAFSVLGLMRIAGVRSKTAAFINILIALLCPLSAFITCWGIGLLGPTEAGTIGRALAFGAGALLCISLSDLLPEVHFHGHDRIGLTGAFLAGITLAYTLHYLEGSFVFDIIR